MRGSKQQVLVDANDLAEIIHDVGEALFPMVDWSHDPAEMHINAIVSLKRDLQITQNRLVTLTGYKSADAAIEAMLGPARQQD